MNLHSFNINDYFRVQLTDRGREIHRDRYVETTQKFAGIQLEYTAPKEDNEGWSRWQAWDLMQTFGDSIVMGSPPPFELTIKIELPESK